MKKLSEITHNMPTAVKVILMVIVFFAGMYVSMLQHDKVPYLDKSCPMCGSCEILDFGTQNDGVHGWCTNCKKEIIYEE